jgi:kynurenine formamidase
MSRLLDVSHVVEDGLTTYPGLPAPLVGDFLSREASREHYSEGTSFQIARIERVANTGTYVDSPFHRYEDGADLADLDLVRLADLDGGVIDATAVAGRAIEAVLLAGRDLAGKAALVRTGWDRHWATPRYFEGHPYLTRAAAVLLREAGAALVGIDAFNSDDLLTGRARRTPFCSELASPSPSTCAVCMRCPPRASASTPSRSSSAVSACSPCAPTLSWTRPPQRNRASSSALGIHRRYTARGDRRACRSRHA